MFKAFLLVVAIALPTTLLVGCAKTEEQKTQEQIDAGNAMLTRNAEIKKSLRDKNIFIISATSEDEIGVAASMTSIKAMTESERKTVAGLLREFITNSNEVISLIDSGKATSTKPTLRPNLMGDVKCANKLLQEINRLL